MSTPEVDEAIKESGLWFAILQSLANFDEGEVKGVVNGLISPTIPEECLVSIYYRVAANVRSLLELKTPNHFQAIGMLARSVFELAVDMAIFSQVQSAPLKMRVFMDVEKLRACRSAIKFKTTNTPTFQKSLQVQQDYITNNEARIMSLASTTWKGVSFKDIKHWSNMTLAARVKLLPLEMQELYAMYYRQLSWSVHSGLQGSYGLKPETFAHMCGMAFNLAARDYERVLHQIIKTVKLDMFDPLLEKKMKLARYLPLTENAEQEVVLRRDLGL